MTSKRLQKIGITSRRSNDRAFSIPIFHVRRYIIVLLKTLADITFSKQCVTKVAFEAQSIMKTFLQFDIILTAFDFKKLFVCTILSSKYLQTALLDYLTANQMLIGLRE